MTSRTVKFENTSNLYMSDVLDVLCLGLPVRVGGPCHQCLVPRIGNWLTQGVMELHTGAKGRPFHLFRYLYSLDICYVMSRYIIYLYIQVYIMIEVG